MFLVKQAHHSVVCQLDLKGFDGGTGRDFRPRGSGRRACNELIAARGAGPGGMVAAFMAEHSSANGRDSIEVSEQESLMIPIALVAIMRNRFALLSSIGRGARPRGRNGRWSMSGRSRS